MENNEKRFEDYFAGRMSTDEVLQFNDELNSNPKLNSDYQYFLALKNSTASIERDNFRAQLADVNLNSAAGKSNAKTKNGKSSFDKLGQWVVIVIGTLLLAYFSFQYFSSDKPAYIYAANFEVYEPQMSRGGSMEEITSLYTEGKYEEFISRVEVSNHSPEIMMMLANANMELGNFDAAEKLLLTISEESSLRDLKYWNLALVSLMQDHIPQATNHFRHLQSISNFKKSEVEKILSKLSK